MRKALFLPMVAFFLLGCQSHYTLYIVASPAPPSAPAVMASEGAEIVGEPRETEPLAPPSVPTTPQAIKPMSNTPGAFTATQSQGGSMVNVTINLNLEKPTAVSTQTPISVSGIPGM